MTLDQFYGLLDRIQHDPDVTKSRSMNRLIRESEMAKALRAFPEIDDDDD